MTGTIVEALIYKRWKNIQSVPSTGLTTNMREDFRVMKDLATHTRIEPKQRSHTLHSFMQLMKKNPEALKNLEQWGLSFASDLLEFGGRQLPTEKINVRSRSSTYRPDNPDWTNDIRSNHLISTKDLSVRPTLITHTKVLLLYLGL